MKIKPPIPTQPYQQKKHPAIFPDFLFSPGGVKKSTDKTSLKKWFSHRTKNIRKPQPRPTWKDTDWQTILSPILDLGNKAHMADLTAGWGWWDGGWRWRFPPGLFCPDGNAGNPLLSYSVSDGKNSQVCVPASNNGAVNGTMFWKNW